MRRIDELKKEIIHEILNSEEYREYRRLQNEIDRIPDLKRQIDEFRQRMSSRSFSGMDTSDPSSA